MPTLTCAVDDDCAAQGKPSDRCVNGECSDSNIICYSDQDCAYISNGAVWVCSAANYCMGAGVDGDPCPNSSTINNRDCATGFGCYKEACREDCTSSATCTLPGYTCVGELPFDMPGMLRFCVP
jgi:hypothetical protein